MDKFDIIKSYRIINQLRNNADNLKSFEIVEILNDVFSTVNELFIQKNFEITISQITFNCFNIYFKNDIICTIHEYNLISYYQHMLHKMYISNKNEISYKKYLKLPLIHV